MLWTLVSRSKGRMKGLGGWSNRMIWMGSCWKSLGQVLNKDMGLGPSSQVHFLPSAILFLPSVLMNVKIRIKHNT